MNHLSYAREEWVDVTPPGNFTNTLRLEISNFGKVRTHPGNNKYNFLKGSMINGYKIIRLKMFRPRSAEEETKLGEYRAAISAYDNEIKQIKKIIKSDEESEVQKSIARQKIESIQVEREREKLRYQKYLNKITRKNTFNYGCLVHRLVAENFLTPPSPEHTFVAHLNYDKLNNIVSNLSWMTREENVAHQQKSPYVIAQKRKRKENDSSNTKVSKLTLTQVMFLKKLLNEGKTIASLARKFKVTQTQIIRIKKNENWASVEAAK
ncbi:MAG: HNH endonuclease [Bacteroidetes bacterium]|nr:HNH endonuclease [Bacteroidota bacterium]